MKSAGRLIAEGALVALRREAALWRTRFRYFFCPTLHSQISHFLFMLECYIPPTLPNAHHAFVVRQSAEEIDRFDLVLSLALAPHPRTFILSEDDLEYGPKELAVQLQEMLQVHELLKERQAP